MTHDAHEPPPPRPSAKEWDRLTDAIESLDRTVRGDAAEGHDGLMGRVRRLERGLYTLLGAVAVLAVENAPDFLRWLGALLP